MYRRFGKRLLDLMITIPLLVVLSPVQLLIALLVRRSLGAPVLFRQPRTGRHGVRFTMLKFRTMTDATDVDGRLLADEHRLTHFGNLLRRTSLDELPELMNVLRGDMSLVGPRPLLVRYLDRYTPEQLRRHDVMPGITGWAQVNGRNAVDWETRFAMDIWYVTHQSLRLDIRILLLTLRQVFRREGINQEGHVTMTEFMGCANISHGDAG